MHIDLFKFFKKMIENIDQSFNNYINVILDDFFLKESVIFSFYRSEYLYFLIHNNIN